MKKRLSIILCIALILCLLPTSSVFAAKKVKSKSVSVAPKSMTLAVGDIAQLSAKMKPSNTTDKLKWSSSNKKVATVSSKGVVQGVSEGTATITVKTTSKKTAKCVVTVKDYATDAEVRGSLEEEFMKKDEIQPYLNQNYYRKEEIDKKIKGVSTDGFATKDELQALSQNTYTKSEVGSQISASEAISKEYVASEESIAAIREKLKNVFATNDSVLSLIKQNAYTKSEMDSKLAEISTGGSCNCDDELSANGKVVLHSGQKMSFSDHEKTFTITGVDITKSLYNDFVDSSNGTRQFYVYRYDVTITGTTDSETLFSEVLFTNKYGGSFWFDFNNVANDTASISGGKFTMGTTLYNNINASELIISHLQTKEEFGEE